MTPTQATQLKLLRGKLQELANRLSGEQIGEKPITKKTAAVVVYGVVADIKVAFPALFDI